ncbi:major capsid protein [Halomonas sp. Mc5H-6]|uniref:major capsid protein n=1 Tax=Halomonas sp. Mc5H-6 TaxID=2954500 RepID=UPI002097D8CB|nr:major capsid protein [Halomonas sp. Mc5H-6]MCO7248221.1 hypothetical protein [Halomonas sp. Mc5H-6]
MATLRLTDIIEPSSFTEYQIQESMQKTALVRAGVAVQNPVIASQLAAGAQSFTVPFWHDLADDEANIVNDDPAILSSPKKIGSGKQIIRKSFLHQSWSAMNLASEIAGDDALMRIQSRVLAYWDRQLQRRLVASLRGILADNVATDASDMVVDISAETDAAGVFGAEAVIDASGTLGDSMNDLVAIGMHSDVYRRALKNDLIEFIPDSQGGTIATFRGLATVVDDGLPVDGGNYTSVLFGRGAVGYGAAAPQIAEGTEVENLPSAGRGGGQQILHSRMNIGMHPAGFSWQETTVSDESPSLSELILADNWTRTVERKAVPLAFLIARVE